MPRKKLVIASDVDQGKITFLVNELRNIIARWDNISKDEILAITDNELHIMNTERQMARRILTMLHEAKVIDLGVKS